MNSARKNVICETFGIGTKLTNQDFKDGIENTLAR